MVEDAYQLVQIRARDIDPPQHYHTLTIRLESPFNDWETFNKTAGTFASLRPATSRYNVSFMILTYFLPMIVMCYTYSRVGLELWGSRAIGETSQAQTESIKSKRKVSSRQKDQFILILSNWP